MGDVAFFYPPTYQRAPEGSTDSLGGGTGGGSGAPGVPGKDGASTLTGSAPPPDSLGKDNDTYVQLSADGDALFFWGPKANGRWPANGISMVGAAGMDAPFPVSGDGPPDQFNVGRPGQIYLDKRNAQIYLAQA